MAVEGPYRSFEDPRILQKDGHGSQVPVEFRGEIRSSAQCRSRLRRFLWSKFERARGRQMRQVSVFSVGDAAIAAFLPNTVLDMGGDNSAHLFPIGCRH